MNTNMATIEEVLVSGNLSNLNTSQRLDYLNKLCESLKLNPLTKPFEYITLNGKLTLYAKKDCTDQLRRVQGISIYKMEHKTDNDIYTVTAYAKDLSGREDISTGAVNIANLKGEALANAFLKAESKAKRRVTLSIGGLGMLDETEIESIKMVNPRVVNDHMALNVDVNLDSYKIDSKTLSGFELNMLIREKIADIKEQVDIDRYDIWKAANKESLSRFCRDHKEICADFADLIQAKRLELEAE